MKALPFLFFISIALIIDQYSCKCEWKTIDNIRYCTTKIYSTNFLKHKLSQICLQKYHSYDFTNDLTREVDVICGQEGTVRKCFIQDYIICAKPAINSENKEGKQEKLTKTMIHARAR